MRLGIEKKLTMSRQMWSVGEFEKVIAIDHGVGFLEKMFYKCTQGKGMLCGTPGEIQRKEQNPLMVREVGECWKKSLKSVDGVGFGETISK